MSDVIQDLANASTGLTLAGGASTTFYVFVTNNAAAVGLTLTFVSLVVAVFFHVLNYRINRKRLLIAMSSDSPGLSSQDMIDIRKILNKRRKG